MTSKGLDAILVQSEAVPDDAQHVKGPDFNLPIGLQELLQSYGTIGYQATSFKQAIDIVNKMASPLATFYVAQMKYFLQRQWRLSDDPTDPDEDEKYLDPETRANTKAHIMLGFTSNLVSSGLREVIRFLVQHSYVSGIVTTAGGIEEDLVKCLGPTYVAPQGRFDIDGAGLRQKGLNRIGNLIVPNNNYCAFEDWITPIFEQMVAEQPQRETAWSPSSVIDRLGKEIDNEESYLYWAHENKIPVFCPALTDGSLGDMLWSHSYKTESPFVIDLVQDIRKLNDMSMYAKKAGMIILGGGVCKHQIANSMLFRNGADYAVYINTGQEFDGSDSGARPDEAVSWGKIRSGAESVKVFADATLVFPLLVAATWAKDHATKATA